MPWSDEKIDYQHTIGYTILLGIIGALLVAISIVISKSPDNWLVEVLRDFGIMLFPLFVVSLIYEVALRKQFDRRLNGIMSAIGSDRGFVQIVYQEDRQKKMEEIIDNARDSLVLVGTSPLFEFAKTPDVLIKRFQELRSVTIAYLAPDSQYIRSREVQSGTVDDGVRGQLQVHDLLVQKLKDKLKNSNVEFIPYNLPPAEFFYICDNRMLLANWYPFGEMGEQCPCIFVDNLQRNRNSERLLNHYLLSLGFITSNFGRASDSKRTEPQPTRSSASQKGLFGGEARSTMAFFNPFGEPKKRPKTDRDGSSE